MEHQPPKVNEPEPEQDKPEYSDEHPYAEGLNPTVEIVEHVPEDDLELYAIRTLPAPESDSLEEHLLICFGVPGSASSHG